MRQCDRHRARKSERDVLAQFAGEKFRFIAPDALLASDEQADWPAVDEAAATTCAVVASTGIAFSSNRSLTTTVQGYEGTYVVFCSKFCARFPHLTPF
ncbi:hypothetical protein ACNKHV_15535 [Shigella flexneri]